MTVASWPFCFIKWNKHQRRSHDLKIVNISHMLRMYVRYYPKKWEDYLHLVKFAYNNHYQASTKLSPFEILYG